MPSSPKTGQRSRCVPAERQSRAAGGSKLCTPGILDRAAVVRVIVGNEHQFVVQRDGDGLAFGHRGRHHTGDSRSGWGRQADADAQETMHSMHDIYTIRRCMRASGTREQGLQVPYDFHSGARPLIQCIRSHAAVSAVTASN